MTRSGSADEPQQPPPIPPVVANWYLKEKLGSGYSGSIYRAVHVHTQQEVALKLQWVHHECPTNRYERGFYPSLQGGLGMPTLWAAGVQGEWDYLAIDLLGASLDNLYRKSKKEVMDLRSVCCIAMQVISRIEFMHNRGILHRDIQLGNCVVGLPPNHQTVYMIDFGFSKRYIDPRTHQHIPDSKAKRDFIGNYWFSSVNVHCRGKVPSRRDDLEAVALMLIHILTPRGLPWTRHGVPKTDEEHDRLKWQKKLARPEELCAGLPSPFEEFLRYSRRLSFKDQPDYAMWIEEFKALAVENGFPESANLVWPPPVQERKVTRPRGSTEGMEGILKQLAQVQIHDRPVLGDRKNVAHAIERERQQNALKPAKAKGDSAADVIEISDDESGRRVRPQEVKFGKAQNLIRLRSEIAKATNNQMLSTLVAQFTSVLKDGSTRTMTREAFAFLDALHVQLADPEVFELPRRTRSQSREFADQSQLKGVKVETLARLKSQVGTANNRALGDMVTEFEQVIANSNGKYITKDGIAFLQGLATRLEQLT